MLKVSSLIIRISMISAVLVAMAAAGILLVVATPQSVADKYCEAEHPKLVYEQDRQGTKATVMAVAPACHLVVPEGTEYSLTLAPGGNVSGPSPELMIPVNADGSFKLELPLDASELPGPVTGLIQAQASGGECADADSCAVRQWAVRIEPQGR